MLAQFGFYLPVPVGYRAIAYPEPYAQNEPAARGGAYHKKMRPTQRFPYPAKQVKTYDGKV